MGELGQRLMAEAAELRFFDFDVEDAWLLGIQMRDAAVVESLPIAIAITVAGQQLFHAALPGSCADDDAWLQRMSRVVLCYGESSLAVAERFRAQGLSFDADSGRDRSRYAARGGAIPIRLLGGTVIGAVGVSGMPEREGHDFVARMLRTYLDDDQPPAAAPAAVGRRFQT
jgi:uncharacterized protein (UPF0303 family)